MDHLAAALITVLCLIVVWLIWAGQGRNHHLSNRGWMLYMLPNCQACKAQMEIIGSRDGGYSPAYLCGIDGSAADENAKCPAQFPTWVNLRTGAVRVGVQDSDALDEMARSSY